MFTCLYLYEDPKWRFFWRIGERPESTLFPQLNAEQVVPVNIQNWTTVMDTWGVLLLDAVSTASQMCAVGLGMHADTFTNMTKGGPHLLAPTAS